MQQGDDSFIRSQPCLHVAHEEVVRFCVARAKDDAVGGNKCTVLEHDAILCERLYLALWRTA
eukprot:352652-Chlamydomonas_euryale.AAC.1